MNSGSKKEASAFDISRAKAGLPIALSCRSQTNLFINSEQRTIFNVRLYLEKEKYMLILARLRSRRRLLLQN